MRLSFLVAATMAVVLVLPAGASGKTQTFTGKAVARIIDGNTIAGYTTSNIGDGAAVYETSAGPNGTILAKFTVFAARGTYSGTATTTQTPGAEGQPTVVEGTAKIKR